MRDLVVVRIVLAMTFGLVAEAGMAVQVSSTAPLQGPIPESGSATGYPDVASALAALRARPGVQFRTEDNWLIAVDRANQEVWAFAPQGDPAYPAAVKRYAVQQDGRTGLATEILCEASKTICDDLVRRVMQRNQMLLPQ